MPAGRTTSASASDGSPLRVRDALSPAPRRAPPTRCLLNGTPVAAPALRCAVDRGIAGRRHRSRTEWPAGKDPWPRDRRAHHKPAATLRGCSRRSRRVSPVTPQSLFLISSLRSRTAPGASANAREPAARATVDLPEPDKPPTATSRGRRPQQLRRPAPDTPRDFDQLARPSGRPPAPLRSRWSWREPRRGTKEQRQEGSPPSRPVRAR